MDKENYRNKIKLINVIFQLFFNVNVTIFFLLGHVQVVAGTFVLVPHYIHKDFFLFVRQGEKQQFYSMPLYYLYSYIALLFFTFFHISLSHSLVSFRIVVCSALLCPKHLKRIHSKCVEQSLGHGKGIKAKRYIKRKRRGENIE